MQYLKKRKYRLLPFLLAAVILLSGCQRGSDAPLTPGLSVIEGIPNYDEDVAVKTAHFTVTPGMMAYFFYTYAGGVLAEIQKTKPYDTAKLLHDQMYDETRSYYDMIMNETLSRVCKMLICCEAAYTEGIELTDEQKQQLQAQISTERVRVASEYSMEYEAYLQRQYGKQITQADMESILALEMLASSYSYVLSDRLEAGITKEQVEEQLATGKRDPTPSRNISFLFIPFSGGQAASDKVERACNAMQQSPSTDTLQTLGDLGTLGEEQNLTPENSGIAAITAWLFDATRRVGDWGRLDVEGATYVLIYTGNGLAYDEVKARMDLYDAAYAEWYNSFLGTLQFEYNYDCLDGYDVSTNAANGG